MVEVMGSAQRDGKLNADLELLGSVTGDGNEAASTTAQEATGQTSAVLQAQNVYENSPLAGASAKITDVV